MNENVIEKITEISYFPLKPTTQGLIGFASCLYDGKLSLNSMAVYTKHTGGIRLVFPDTYLSNGKKINVYYPINSEMYEALRKAIELKIETVTKEVMEERINAKLNA